MDDRPRAEAGPCAPARKPEYGSDIIVELMLATGIDVLPLNPGATFRGIHDSMVNYAGKPEIIICGHEEVAVAMAHGYAKATGRIGAAFVHNLVGLQHATLATYHAWLDREPVLLLGATGPMDTTRRRPFIDWIHTASPQSSLVRDYVKWDDQPYSIEAVPEAWSKAYRLAMTDPRGPVYLCFDAALQEDPLPENRSIPIPDVKGQPLPTPAACDPNAVKAIVERLANARFPVLMADLMGRNPQAVPRLVALAERIGAAVIDGGSRFNFPSDHPLNVTGAAADVLARADVVIGFDMKDFYGALSRLNPATRTVEPLISPETWVAHISLDGLSVRSWMHDIQADAPLALRATADSSLALEQILDELGNRVDKDDALRRKGEVRRIHDALRARWDEQARAVWDAAPVSTPRLVAETRRALGERNVVIPMETTRGALRRYWPMNHPGQFLGTVGAGPGFGIGIALGVALAHRHTDAIPVIFQPDGELLYNAVALWTAARYRLPLLIVMFNNRSYYNDVEHQERVALMRNRPRENKWIGMDIDDPPVDFATVARGFGVHGIGPVETPDQLGPALDEAVRYMDEERKPVLVDVITQPR